jgi:hypothetical protein
MDLNSNSIDLAQAKRLVRWLLFAFALLYIISGFGITRYQIVEPLTLGLLTKPLAFKIHDNLILPFAALLALHLYLAERAKR